ncbi:hypothetical protein I4U23_019822 [Adineta vaga]|nr:hypothetical protein I4U23_019822 [Adineta vaga]
MAVLYKILFICSILLIFNQHVDGFNCYSCTGCNDPFNSSGITTVAATTGGYCTEISVVNRGTSGSCSSVNILGNGQWCCQTDLCNSATQLFSLSSIVISGYTNSLVCYSCSDCSDPFDPSGIDQISVNTSDLYCKKTKGATIIDRNITDTCSPFTVGGNGVHCCQTDLCNGSNQILSINPLIIVLIIGFITTLI